MLTQLRPAIVMIVAFTLLLGLVVPLAFTGAAGVVLPFQAGGSLLERDGQRVGSALIGQDFTADKYFHGRLSALSGTDPKDPAKTVPTPYDASESGASNLGPTSKALVDRVQADVKTTPMPPGMASVPTDMLTTSGSGLDPDISPATAAAQVDRVAKARNLPPEQVRALIAEHSAGRLLGVFGQPHVNVLRLNLTLDAIGHG